MNTHRGFDKCVLIGSLFIAATWTSQVSAQPRRVKAKGEVVTVVGNVITMLDADKKLLTVRPKAESPLIEISGPWEFTDIKPEMLVRFSGTLKANVLVEEVAEITLHSPADGYQLGIQQDAPDQPATIVGQFVRAKDGQLTLAVGKRRINAKLAKDAAVNVDSKDLRFVRKGDQIEIDAYTTNSGTLSGRSIKVTIKPPKAPDGDEKKAKRSKTASQER